MQLGFRLAALFNPKARLWVRGQSQLWESLEGYETDASTAWFHCASVGEFEQARPVLESFRKQHPDWRIVLTFFSPSGYELRKNYDQADLICYIPADTASNARKFIDVIQPKLVFWARYEYWYAHLNELHERNIPILLYSAIFRPDQIFFRWYGGGHRRMLQFFTHLFVQNQASVDLLQSLHIENVTLAGDTRYDRVVEIASQAKRVQLVEDFSRNTPVIIGGSIWPEDWSVLSRWIRESGMLHQPEAGNADTYTYGERTYRLPTSALKFVLAPHEIDSEQIDTWIAEAPLRSVRFSTATPETLREADILWIDNIGMLASLYRYGHFAFIGGGYEQGLHSILEAAVWGMPVFFGDQEYDKFQEAHDMIELGSAHPVSDSQKFHQLFTQLLQNPEMYRVQAKNSREFVYAHVGATEKIMEWANHLL